MSRVADLANLCAGVLCISFKVLKFWFLKPCSPSVWLLSIENWLSSALKQAKRESLKCDMKMLEIILKITGENCRVLFKVEILGLILF